MLLGRWRDDAAVEIGTATELILRTRKKTLKVMLDGEVQTLTTPLRFRIRPLALTLLTPLPESAPASALAAPGTPG